MRSKAVPDAGLRSRLNAVRERARTAQPEPVPIDLLATVKTALGPKAVTELEAGAPGARQWTAMRNRDDVGRMSLAGMPVAQIAAAVGLSVGQVCALRRQLGLGRKR